MARSTTKVKGTHQFPAEILCNARLIDIQAFRSPYMTKNQTPTNIYVRNSNRESMSNVVFSTHKRIAWLAARKARTTRIEPSWRNSFAAIPNHLSEQRNTHVYTSREFRPPNCGKRQFSQWCGPTSESTQQAQRTGKPISTQPCGPAVKDNPPADQTSIHRRTCQP